MALQVATRTPTDSAGVEKAHSTHGERQSTVGRGAHCQRAAGEIGHPGLAANGKEVPAQAAAWSPAWRSTWSTFLSNHAKGIIACDFFLAVTATFRSLYVFVLIHHASRQLLHINVTAHPTAAWTLQQLREVIGEEDGYRYLVHDRDSIFAKTLDQSLERLGLEIVKSPPQSPMANAICERVIGTIRRECLDWMIPISEAHLRSILNSWVRHYNRGRPHSRLGPGVPDAPDLLAAIRKPKSRHRLEEGVSVLVKSVLGGLHYEYSMVPNVA